jgi:polyamine oxidase
MLVVSGYQRFAQSLVDNHNIEVYLNHRVVEASYREEAEQTVVVCANGKQFTADSVVINVPIGVLKKGAIKFNPRLPNEKTGAI